MTKKVKISDKAQEASYIVAELITKRMKPHTLTEEVVAPACCEIVRLFCGEEAAKEVSRIPLSDNTMSRRIADMSHDIEGQVCLALQSLSKFSLQVDESTDVSGKAQLLAFVHMIYEGNILENFLCCKALLERTTADKIFWCVDQYYWNQQICHGKSVLEYVPMGRRPWLAQSLVLCH